MTLEGVAGGFSYIVDRVEDHPFGTYFTRVYEIPEERDLMRRLGLEPA